VLIAVAAATVVAVESRSAHGVTHRGPGPAAARALVLAVFAVEARAQLSTGITSVALRNQVDDAERTMAPAAARWFARRIARDTADARRVGDFAGIGWNRARAWIRSSTILGSTATSVQLLVNIEDALQIDGTHSNTLTAIPYVIDLERKPNGNWRIRRLAFQDPYDANN
jgi:hypothetical protein